MKKLATKWYVWVGVGLVAIAAVMLFSGDTKIATTIKNILPGGTDNEGTTTTPATETK